MSGELILEVRNGHRGVTGEFKWAFGSTVGTDALIGGPGGRFVSYFEGSAGDQWLCFEAVDDELYVTGGDVEWRTYPILPKDDMPGWAVGDLVLSVPEGQWLDACWRSWQARRKSSG